MAINSTEGIKLLNHIVMGKDEFSTYNSVYLGLLTRLPASANSMGTYDEVPTGTSENPTGYARLLIAASQTSKPGLSGANYFPAAASWDSNEGAVVLKNSGDDIIMHNILETQTEFSEEVVGFGLFTAATGGTMIAYGDLVDADGYKDSVVLGPGSVPIFYKNGLRFIFRDDPAENPPAQQENS